MQAVETPRRPRPPAKIRRSLAKGSTTPPPAYAPTFAFPTAKDEFDAAGTEWDGDGEAVPGANPDNLDDDLAWLNEKSRDELTDLLVKADTLIKDRESGDISFRPVDHSTELSLTSAACKTLYDNNVALKTKHEALLHRISPNRNQNIASSPTQSPGLPVSPLRPAFATLSRSTSEFGVSGTPEQMLSKSYSYKPRRGVSAPTLDISFLADQNAELLSKLEKLESDASSADMAGRRELRKLEKDIGILKEELEKTRARSDELEEKARSGFGLGAEKVVEEAWKRKKEREARLKALKNLKSHSQGSSVRNFAPDAPSLYRAIGARQFPAPDLSVLEEASMLGEDTPDMHDTRPLPPPTQDEQLITKLLQKIQELEVTNSKILQHQTETSSRLQAVQRETEFMTKIYERLNELDEDHGHDEVEAKDQVPDGLANRFAKSHRALQSQLLAAKVKRQRSYHKHENKSRGSIAGLFDEPANEISTPLKPKSSLPVPFSEGSWNRPRHHSSYSIGSGGLASPALSSLSLYSPPSRVKEISEMVGPSLANELGDEWGLDEGTDLLRPRSLSDLSIGSASPSPRPISSEAIQHQMSPDHLPTPPGPTNSLQLSVEPPTPQKGTPVAQHHESQLIGNMSPRFQVSRSLRARNYLYIEGRYPEPLGPSLNQAPQRRTRFTNDDASPTPARGPSGGPFLFEGFQVMMDAFDERNGIAQPENGNADISRSPSPAPEDYADAKEELDEGDQIPASANVETADAHRRKDELEEEGEIYSEENSLSARSHTSEVSKSSTVGGIMLEVWMWLQFAIIMLVFLWAMARKGPKSVLKDVERKRTLSMKKRA
ncbi:hypothetical protein NP233_g2696 [Leucocoprinus birnbaumii]|uniref:Uncharacterized protein n=1 Tax=Leucocoprinus birnbaumii TaxID=56174 RepID=A0AAD5W079_9AGAR|nr:hypothetical protein NP233_g2696 [Leucocoprinus birnbaumii]